MSWVKENKFLAGFTAATVVGAGALGFLTFQAKGRYDAATTSFEEQSAELSRLQNAQPFPSAENVKKVEEQRKEFQQAIVDLQEKASKKELPIEQISPQQFQDRLRQTVDSIAKRAAESAVELDPATASLGFERYLAEPPRPEAAPPLGRQLKAIELVVGNMIDARVAKISALKRDELPEEKGGTQEPELKKGSKQDKGDKELVAKHPFDIAFISNQAAMMKVLNSLVTSEQQFFIPRFITVKNEKDTGPSKIDPMLQNFGAPPVAPVPADPNAAPQPGAAPAAPANPAFAGAPGQTATPYIVGEEKAEVTMRVEIVDFAEKATAAK